MDLPGFSSERSWSEGRKRPSWAFGLAGLFAVTLAPAPASALQPLEQFLSAARSSNPANQEADSVLAQREAEEDQSYGRLAPTFTGRAAYARNQYEAILPANSFGPGSAPVTITPRNQLDASLTLDVPIIDVGAWYRVGAARASHDAAKARASSTSQDTSKEVARVYFQVVGSTALVDAAQKALQAAQASEAVVAQRHAAGVASDLESDRAVAEVARARQSVAETELQQKVARRSLQTLTGVSPEEGAASLPALGPDPSLGEETLEQQAVPNLPGVRAAALESKAADRNASYARAALLPTIAASAQERFTNAAGFSGHEEVYTLGLSATWRLDYVSVANVKAQNAALAAARARENRARLAAQDEIHTAYNQLSTQLAKGDAARTQAKASAHAAQIARERYAGGSGTQLDVIQADRDAFQAEASRIQADLDLAYARVVLRIDTGLPAVPSAGGGQ